MRLRCNQVLIPMIIVIVVNSLNCDDSVNPSAPFVTRMVVYSVLTSQSDTQYVRIYTTYNPQENNTNNQPDEGQVTDATVTVTDGTTTYVFRDTIIARPDTSKYKSPIHLYYCYPMVVEPAKQYSLLVNSQTYGTATANLTVSAGGTVRTVTPNVLNNPILFQRDRITIEFGLSPGTGGYLLRLYVVFTADNPWEPEETRYNEKFFEIPIRRMSTNPSYEECSNIIYPGIRKAGSIPPPHPVQGPRLSAFTFSNSVYRHSLARIVRSHSNVRFKRAVIYFVQFDNAWYKYYATTNLFEDRLGVRLSNPTYSNISTGSGLFGSAWVDSTVAALQESIEIFPPGSGDDGYIYCTQEAPPLPQPLEDLHKFTFRP